MTSHLISSLNFHHKSHKQLFAHASKGYPKQEFLIYTPLPSTCSIWINYQMVPLFWYQDVDARLHLRRWQRVVAWGGLMALGSLWCHENNRELSLCWGVFWNFGMRFFGIFMDFSWTGGYPRVADMCDQHWDSYGTPNRQFPGGWRSTTSSIRDSWLVQPVGSTDSYNSWSMLSIQMHSKYDSWCFGTAKLFRTMCNIPWVFSSWWYRFFMFFQSIPHGPSEEKLLLSSC